MSTNERECDLRDLLLLVHRKKDACPQRGGSVTCVTSCCSFWFGLRGAVCDKYALRGDRTSVILSRSVILERMHRCFGVEPLLPRGKKKCLPCLFILLQINLTYIINNKQPKKVSSSSTSNSVYARRVDSSALVFSLSSHRHSYIGLVCNSRFID
jgi:hypothetical protein